MKNDELSFHYHILLRKERKNKIPLLWYFVKSVTFGLLTSVFPRSTLGHRLVGSLPRRIEGDVGTEINEKCDVIAL